MSITKGRKLTQVDYILINECLFSNSIVCLYIWIHFRSGIKTGYQFKKITRFRERGVKVSISKRDARTMEGARGLFEDARELAPVGGLFNLAMVSLFLN